MGSFRAELDRLTRQFISGVVEVAQAAAARGLAEAASMAAPRGKGAQTIPKRTVRVRLETATTSGIGTAARPSVVRVDPIIVPPRPGRRRRVSRGRGESGMLGDATSAKVSPPQPETSVRFEVVPHPVRAGRRLVMTRIGS